MSDDVKPVDVPILGKEYRVSCPPEEEKSLRASAAYLDQRMREIRDSGKVFGTDRIAVMAALNIAHELLRTGDGAGGLDRRMSERLRLLDQRVARALSDEEGQQPLI